MKKETFLHEIRQDATVAGSKAEVAWKAAMNISESDHRWTQVEEYDTVGTFGLAFGVTLPVYAKLRRSNPVERFEKKLAQARLHGTDEDIAYLEKKLAQAKAGL